MREAKGEGNSNRRGPAEEKKKRDRERRKKEKRRRRESKQKRQLKEESVERKIHFTPKVLRRKWRPSRRFKPKPSSSWPHTPSLFIRLRFLFVRGLLVGLKLLCSVH
jgi:hypothetical protein